MYSLYDQNTWNPLNVILTVPVDSWFQFYLPYVEISYVYDVIYDLIQEEGSGSNCTDSYWSVLFILVSHITIVPFICQAVFNFIGLIRCDFLCKEDYSWLEIICFQICRLSMS